MNKFDEKTIEQKQQELQQKQQEIHEKAAQTVTETVRRISNWELLWKILRISYFQWFVLIYTGVVVVISWILMQVEPGLTNMGDALWYSFAVLTTIGLGDFTAVTLVGRILSVILGISGLVVVAFLTGIIIDFIQEKLKARRDESIVVMMDKLESLPDLTQAELDEIAEQIRRINR